MFSRDDVISVYTRDDAINDGVLVDLMQGELGDVCRQHYKYPIACTDLLVVKLRRNQHKTASVWGIISEAVSNPKFCNDDAGILHDMLHMSKVLYEPYGDDTRLFSVIITCLPCRHRQAGVGKRKYHRFKIVCGPGDSGEPVLTIMLPDED